MRILSIAAVAVLGLLLVCACKSVERAATNVQRHWRPWTNQVTTSQELAAVLEARWSLEMIRAYCRPTAPTLDNVQNLVALGEEWRAMRQG